MFFKPKKRRGRPSLPKGESRGVVPVRLKPSEKALFQKAADAGGVSLSEWIRKTLEEKITKS